MESLIVVDPNQNRKKFPSPLGEVVMERKNGQQEVRAVLSFHPR
ncbi:hypothetical protein [Nostoc sp.]